MDSVHSVQSYYNLHLSAEVDIVACSSHGNPLPHMPILGSSNSAVNKDMMSKIRTNTDAII